MKTLIKEAFLKECKLPFFPNLLPNETPYSLVSRYVTLTGESSRKISYILFGSEKIISSSLNGNLSRFCEKTDIKDEPTKILIENTILPLYLMNYRKKEVDNIINELLNGNARSILTELSYRKSHIMICPECTMKDIEQYGMPYLRREHHIPGIFYCNKHRIQLQEIVVGNESYANLNKFETKDITLKGDKSLHIALANIAGELISHHIDRDKIDKIIKQQLVDHYYINNPNKRMTKTSKLQDDFENHFGVDFLNEIGLSGFEIKINWLQQFITRGKNINIQPIAYITFISFFADSVDEFINTENRQLTETKKRKPKSEVVIKKRRDELDKIITTGAKRTDLYKLHSGLYRYFIRYDRAYLDMIAPKTDKVGNGKIDWEKADLKYLEQCQLLYLFLKTKDGYPRLTKNYFAKIIGTNSIIHYKNKLPKTHSFLDLVIETYDEARLRKTCDFADQLVEDGKYSWDNITMAKIHNAVRQNNYSDLKKIKKGIDNYIAYRQVLEQIDTN